MATTSRSETHPLITDIVEDPRKYSFVQALRILERLEIIHAPNSPDEGDRFSRSSSGLSARFVNQCNLTFPATAISNGKIDAANRLILMVSTFGLIGPVGVMPYSYSTLVASTIRDKNFALKAFIDIFQNRSVQLFYGACTKYRLVVSYERKEKDHGDDFRAVIDSTLGLNTRHLRDRLTVDDDLFAYYAGYFSSQRRSIYGLEKILSDVLNATVRVDAFRGYWVQIPEDEQSSLSNDQGRTSFNELGVNLVVGERVWSAQNSFRLYVGPVSASQFMELLPNGSLFAKTKEIVAFYCGEEFRFEIKILLEREAVPASRIQNEENAARGAILGRKSWVLSSQSPSSRDDPSFIQE